MKSALMLIVLIVVCTYYTHAEAAEVEPFVGYDHTSDIFRGAPFNDDAEVTVDWLGAGATITAGKRKRFEIDLAHGVKQIDRGATEQGSKLSVRFYPGRGR